MSTEEFYNRHKKNGVDLAKWDGTIKSEPIQQRQPNPKLKRHNYKFANQIEVIDAEIVANQK